MIIVINDSYNPIGLPCDVFHNEGLSSPFLTLVPYLCEVVDIFLRKWKMSNKCSDGLRQRLEHSTPWATSDLQSDFVNHLLF